MLALALAGAMLAGAAGCAHEATVSLAEHAVIVEIADSAEERATGLQGHAPLGPGEGMLFVWDDAAVRTFVMKSVTFPIDVVFIGEDRTVTAIERLDPGETRPVSSPGPSAYAIELPRGWAEANGIAVGSAFVPPR